MCDECAAWLILVLSDDDNNSYNNNEISENEVNNTRGHYYTEGVREKHNSEFSARLAPFRKNSSFSSLNSNTRGQQNLVNRHARLSHDGWLNLIRLQIERVPVFAYLIDGYLLYYSKEIPKYKLGDAEFREGLIDLTGATCRKKSFEGSYEIGVRTHDDLFAEFDAENPSEQEIWFRAINNEIEEANIACIQRAETINEGVKEWQIALMKRKKAAFVNLRGEVNMVITWFIVLIT